MRLPNATCVRVSALAAVGSLRAAVALVLIGLLSATCYAATRSWDGGGGTDIDWTTDANWSSNIEPGASDIAVFDRGTAFNYNVTFPILISGGDITTDRLIVGSNTVTFEPDHSSTDYIAAQPTTIEADPILGMPVRGITIGADASDTSAVLVSHLSLLQAVAATLGHASGSSGTLTLNQNNDQFNVTGSNSTDTELIIGRYGTGVLNVSGGADVNVTNGSGNVSLAEYAGSNGTASIIGAGSTWNIATSLVVGKSGNGTLDVTAGGVVSSVNSYIGDDTGSIGTVTIEGSNSSWINNVLYVGQFGNGTLAVSNGGSVSATGVGTNICIIGMATQSDGRVTVSGATSSVYIDDRLVVGDEGVGMLEITSGGLVISRGNGPDFSASSIARRNGAGTVIVDGAGSGWVDFGQLFYVGAEGQGSLNITGGGRVETGNSYVGRPVSGPESVVTVDGGGSTWQADAVTVNRSGVLVVTNGGTVRTSVASIYNGGKVRGNGTILGGVENGGLVSPGISPGALTVNGFFTQTAAGELQIELASASSYDRLLVSGNAALGGKLTVNLVDGFIPTFGQTFTILTAGNVSGTFSTEVLPAVPNFAFDVVYNATSVVLTLLSALAGDYNGNGAVDAGDYVVWRKNDGSPAGYNTWRMHFGESLGSGAGESASANAAVPEPTSRLVLILGLLAIFFQRRALVP